MKLYVITFELYHENSSVLGLFSDYDAAMAALEKCGEDNPNPPWDDSDSYELQEWEDGKKTRHWDKWNPYEGYPTKTPPVKLGWRIKESEV